MVMALQDNINAQLAQNRGKTVAQRDDIGLDVYKRQPHSTVFIIIIAQPPVYGNCVLQKMRVGAIRAYSLLMLSLIHI